MIRMISDNIIPDGLEDTLKFQLEKEERRKLKMLGQGRIMRRCSWKVFLLLIINFCNIKMEIIFMETTLEWISGLHIFISHDLLNIQVSKTISQYTV